MLVTAGWDHTVRYWDLRQQNPVHTQQLPERVYAMDAVFPVLVVGLGSADRKIQVRPRLWLLHAGSSQTMHACTLLFACMSFGSSQDSSTCLVRRA